MNTRCGVLEVMIKSIPGDDGVVCSPKPSLYRSSTSRESRMFSETKAAGSSRIDEPAFGEEASPTSLYGVMSVSGAKDTKWSSVGNTTPGAVSLKYLRVSATLPSRNFLD